ncbi:pseudouridylate synthase [Leptotrichia buccalis]|uniref:Pseudouridylate synthase-like protein n=1 Tax=Leptotrichia buccalis (strain ATCC 14201 / DSM 1135 / JCM 12969 / NCTC 10249 / C-1013-b) TaxID=523794 RepID=C7NAV8_LEPBD|nr:pseudouridylate synthase [Leptotrichia buccalis]ACV39289.1 Pseudouridylate synthase-like protein [Leptotrichia buccalis C-1013-b]
MEKIDTEKTKMDKLIRDFENTKYFGYMFFVEYDGQKFESFDENPNKKSVKSEFRKILENNKIKIFKGIQQAGRTDANVSAKENILYINSKGIIDFSKLKFLETEGLKINKIVRTLPFLEFPQMIEKRYYIYEYPKKLRKNDEERINQICKKVSGKKNFYEFTSEKGKKLKNHRREIFVKYENDKLYFVGDGFLPQQVRIMSNFILNNTKFDIEKLTDENFENRKLGIKDKPLDGKYLTLMKVDFSEELEKISFFDVKNIEELINLKKNNNENLEIGNSKIKIDDLNEQLKSIDKVKKIERNSYFTVFFVEKKDKGEFIGKRGKNIRKLKKIFGDIVVKEI